MEIPQLRAEIEQHVRNAYALLPAELTPPIFYMTLKRLEAACEKGNWRSVCSMIQYYSRSNSFSDELLDEKAAAYKKIGQLSCLIFQEMLKQTTDEEKQLIAECLLAISHGPFLSDNDFRPLTGLERAEMEGIAKRWPDYDKNDASIPLAVGNSLYGLVVYPHHKESELPKYISVSQQQLEQFAEKWFDLRKQLKD